MKKLKVSILSHNLSSNCLGRAYILAKALSDVYDVEIVGPVLSSGIWEPVSGDTTIIYKKLGKSLNPFRLMSAVDGDIVYAVKPRTASLGTGLLVKLFKRKKLVLDVDDWEVGFGKDFGILGIGYGILSFWDLDSIIPTWLMEKMIPFADAITVSSSFLQKKFGGTLIPHFRDTDVFNPRRFDRKALRGKLGVEGKRVVMFLGSIEPYKGIDTLLSAFDAIRRDDAILMLVGASDKARASLPQRGYLRVIGPQPFEKVPEFLAAADVVALMQRQNSASTQGQLPAKIFDAMSMEKPIIATRVSDIPRILNGCGIVIEDTPEELASAIRWLFDHPEQAAVMGRAARERCIEEYSYSAMRPKLEKVFESLKY